LLRARSPTLVRSVTPCKNDGGDNDNESANARETRCRVRKHSTWSLFARYTPTNAIRLIHTHARARHLPDTYLVVMFVSVYMLYGRTATRSLTPTHQRVPGPIRRRTASAPPFKTALFSPCPRPDPSVRRRSSCRATVSPSSHSQRLANNSQ